MYGRTWSSFFGGQTISSADGSKTSAPAKERYFCSVFPSLLTFQEKRYEHFQISSYTLAEAIVIVMLAGCSGNSSPIAPAPPIGAPGTIPQSIATATHVMPQRIEPAFLRRPPPPSVYKVLYSFGGYSGDGIYPDAHLKHVKGTLYGTTYEGGASTACGSSGCGTVFSITTSGTEKVLHSFGKGSDGEYSPCRLDRCEGHALRHDCGCGGAHGDGTVFSITTSGTEKVLHSFGKGSDGDRSRAGLINVKGTLYGTTDAGGAYDAEEPSSASLRAAPRKCCTASATEATGRVPRRRLIDVKGTLYGTTSYGGAHIRHGTVFSITTSGTEKVLHSFGKGSDGMDPFAGLIDVKGTLYGTTTNGVARTSRGTVFSITTSGTEKVLHSFGKGSDGGFPLRA